MHSGKWQSHSLLIATFECKGIDIYEIVTLTLFNIWYEISKKVR